MKSCNHVNNQTLHDTSCIVNQRSSISLFEHIIILILFMIVPVHLMIMKYIEVEHTWKQVNSLKITSISIAIILIAMLIMYLLFNKPYLALIFGCHQIEERSFKLFKKPFILCARCTGILIGSWMMVFLSQINLNPLYYFFGIIPLAVDGTLQYYTKYTSNNMKRFITGLLFGPVMIVLLSYYYLVISHLIILFIHLIS